MAVSTRMERRRGELWSLAELVSALRRSLVRPLVRFATGTYTKTGKPCHRSGRCMGTCGKPEGRDKNATPNIMKAAVHWLLFGRNLFSARKLKEKR